MNQDRIREACLSLGLNEPISIETDGTVWTGLESNRVYADMDLVRAEVERLDNACNANRVSALGKLSALGLSEAEVKALLG